MKRTSPTCPKTRNALQRHTPKKNLRFASVKATGAELSDAQMDAFGTNNADDKVATAWLEQQTRPQLP